MKRKRNPNDDAIVLPIVTSFARSKSLGVGLIVFGLTFIIPVIFLPFFGTWHVQGWMAVYCMVLFVVTFGGAGTVLFLIGLSKLLAAGELTISSTQVVHNRKRGLFGPDIWSEPVKNYIGVLYAKETSTSGGGGGGHSVYYRIELLHADEEKNATLEETNIETGSRGRWERYAELLQVPAVQETEQGLEIREIAELDLSLSDRIASGAIEIEYDPADIPNGLSAQACGDVLILELEPRPIGVMTVVNILSASIGFILIGIFVQLTFVAVGVAGLIGGGIGMFFHHCPKKLLISPRAISLAIVLPWNPEKQLKHLAAENIEELLISSEVKNSKKEEDSATLRFVTDDDIIEFGKGHDTSTLEWIRGCAASVLSAKGVL